MLLTRVHQIRAAGDTYRVAEISIPRHELEQVARGLGEAISRNFWRGKDTMDIDIAAVGQATVERAQKLRDCWRLVMRGSLCDIDTIARTICASGAVPRDVAKTLYPDVEHLTDMPALFKKWPQNLRDIPAAIRGQWGARTWRSHAKYAGADPCEVTTHDTTYAEFLETAEDETNYIQAMYADLSPYDSRPTVMPANATMLSFGVEPYDRITPHTVTAQPNPEML